MEQAIKSASRLFQEAKQAGAAVNPIFL